MSTHDTHVDKTVAKLEDQLDLWGARLNELVARAEVVGMEVKIDSKKGLNEFKTKLDAARSTLDGVKAAGSDKWGTSRKASTLPGRNLRTPSATSPTEPLETESFMLNIIWGVAGVLVILWVLGIATSTTMGGLIHILLVLAIVSVVARLVLGRSA
jgi:hypothetical protein